MDGPVVGQMEIDAADPLPAIAGTGFADVNGYSVSAIATVQFTGAFIDQMGVLVKPNGRSATAAGAAMADTGTNASLTTIAAHDDGAVVVAGTGKGCTNATATTAAATIGKLAQAIEISLSTTAATTHAVGKVIAAGTACARSLTRVSLVVVARGVGHATTAAVVVPRVAAEPALTWCCVTAVPASGAALAT